MSTVRNVLVVCCGALVGVADTLPSFASPNSTGVEVAASAPAATGTVVSPRDPGWEPSGDAAPVELDGRLAWAMRNGRAIHRGITFGDGTIDLSVKLTGGRSFIYLQFRLADEDDHEEVYLRPHKTGLPDALQYTPVWNGESSWQLHHGPGGTAAVELPAGVWIPLRLVVSGTRGALFVGDLTTPAMVMPLLARPPLRGGLALRAFVPPDAGGAGPTAYFSDLVVRPGELAHDLTQGVAAGVTSQQAPATESAASPISRWQISAPWPAGAPGSAPVLAVPAGLTGWQTVNADPTGRLELYRFFARPDRKQRAGVAARVLLHSPRAQRVALKLGFSDAVTVFLDGQPLVADDDRYTFDDPRHEGLLSLGQLTVLLPLREGSQELLLVLADGFGGMGLIAQLPAESGVTVELPGVGVPVRSSEPSAR